MDGWMDYDKGQDSFSTFVQGKVQISEGAEYKDQWERVIRPTIQAKYVTSQEGIVDLQKNIFDAQYVLYL
jgi:hypothetical protein